MRRKIQIKTNDSNSIHEKTINAVTMQDISNEFPEVNFVDTRIVIRNPRTTITNLNTKLPEGDLFIFTFPSKNSSGK